MPSTLTNLKVIAIDGQATHPNPGIGQLLELGWLAFTAEDEPSSLAKLTKSRMVQTKDFTSIPRHVLRVTGITDSDFRGSHTSESIWRELLSDAHSVAKYDSLGECPAVIHFSRYEEAYMQALHQACAPEEAFPFQVICTHQLAKRLFPNLPRRGLRAVAGFLGHSVHESRRVTNHVLGTAFIWSQMVRLLASEHKVLTLPELAHWLSETEGKAFCGRSYPMDQKTRLALPDSPGVYRMRRSNGDLLYVGKASSLKKRVNSYFQKKSRHADHILEMLAQAQGLDVTVTSSSVEAALLENDEIKERKPPYNVALRESGRAVFFCSRNWASVANDPSQEYPIGPFPSRHPIDLFSALQTVTQEGSLASLSKALDSEYAPDEDNLKLGLELFWEAHGKSLGQNSSHVSFSRLGARLWAERKLAKEEVEEPDEASTEGPKEEWVWTPDRVQRFLEGVLVHSAHLTRRSRWLCALADSVICWDSCSGTGKGRLLTLLNAKVVDQCDWEVNQPVTPIMPRPLRVRKSAFTIPSYDRLNILTTELRRLVKQKGTVIVQFGERRLDRTGLQQVLSWV